jgi:hypothetical protein
MPAKFLRLIHASPPVQFLVVMRLKFNSNAFAALRPHSVDRRLVLQAYNPNTERLPNTNQRIVRERAMYRAG